MRLLRSQGESLYFMQCKNSFLLLFKWTNILDDSSYRFILMLIEQLMYRMIFDGKHNKWRCVQSVQNVYHLMRNNDSLLPLLRLIELTSPSADIELNKCRKLNPFCSFWKIMICFRSKISCVSRMIRYNGKFTENMLRCYKSTITEGFEIIDGISQAIYIIHRTV